MPHAVDPAVPNAFKPSTMRDRAARKAAFDAVHPPSPFAGLVSLGVREEMLTDTYGQPVRLVTVETLVERGTFRPVAQRVDDGLVEWFAQPAPSPLSLARRSWAVRRGGR